MWPAAAAGRLRHRRQPALPPGGRPAGGGPPPHGGLPGADRARAGALPRAQRLYGAGRGGRGGRGLHPAGGGAGTLMHRPTMMVVKSPGEIARLGRAGARAGGGLGGVARAVAPGGVTAELDRLAETFIRDHGGVPSFKYYRGYPASICVSIDAEVVHGIPGTRRLREGRIVSVDLGVYLAGVHGAEAGVTRGGWEVVVLDDGWTVRTRDRARSAHFEHTVAVGADGPEVLTRLNGTAPI